MNRPYIVCHMMMSLDGRIDCPMTEKLPGGDEYYTTMNSYHYDAVLMGKVTAEIEVADKGTYINNDTTPISKEVVSCKGVTKPYDVIVDTNGTLLWDKYDEKDKLVLLLSEKVSKEYLSYLDGLNISYIVTGKERIDLNRAVEILKSDFAVERLVVAGGGHINAGFLKAGLIDEISMVIGAGVDGREKMVSVFDGLPMNYPLTKLHLKDVKVYAGESIWATYEVLK